MSPQRLMHGRAASRRAFLQVGSCGLLGCGLADILRAESVSPRHFPAASSIIMVWLNGGPATIDMWDPKPDAGSDVRGEFDAIATSIPGERFSENMQHTSQILDRCTLVRSLHHNIPDHLPGSQYVMTGNKPNSNVEYPSVGSLAGRLLPSSNGIPAYFSLGEAPNSSAGFLGAQFDPFRVHIPQPPESVSLDGVVLPQGMTQQGLRRRQELRNVFDSEFTSLRDHVDIVPTLTEFQEQAFNILSANRIGRAFDLSAEPPSLRALYGESQIGRTVLIARRLIEAGSRFVTVVSDGWDTHADNFATLRRLLPPVDRALAGLIVDLQQRGMLDETIVVCGGEFGRTPVVNRSAGRDHWPRAMSFLLAGGGFQRGLVYGATDNRGFEPVPADCSPDDLAATLLSQLGFSPQHAVHTTSGRPIRIFEEGRVLEDLVS